MALRKSVEQGDECLTKVCRPVVKFDRRLHDLLDDMAETLANMFRYNIGQPQSLATFEQELENVKNYFLIQQYRCQNRFELQIDIDSEDSEILECQIP